MPKIYEYLGIVIFFYSNEHEPIHIHGKKGEFETKAEFIIINGLVSEIRITKVKGSKPLMGNDLNNFKAFIEIYSEHIVNKWIDFFVYHKKVDFERITKRLK